MKTITLKQNGVGRYDDVSPFIIADSLLELQIKIPAVNGDFYFVSGNDGRKQRRLIPADGKIMLDGLTAGELRAEVKHYFNGELIKTYCVEPLILKEFDGELSAEPEIAVIRGQIAELNQAISEERKAVEKTEQALEDKADVTELEKIKKFVQALYEFAQEAVRKIPYISDYKFTEDLKND